MSDHQPPEEAGLLSLFEARKKISPARVRGPFRRFKWAVMAVLLGIYYLLPWVRWDRGPGAPDQAILVDTINRKFYFFFIELWPQEVIYFTGLLLLSAMALFFVTTLLGRVWCGYACPQTVWTDLFMVVERWVEGDRNARLKLDAAPWTLDKIRKRVVKHAIWLVIGLCTGGAWVFYFQDAPTLMADMLHGHVPFVAGFWVCLLTFSTYLLAGHAREQVCTYMCPYARFQGAMFDEESLIVSYDATRGEPRGKPSDKGAGDCVDCGRCVAVCPTGIDIRDGQQYQCINCALCIDACDEVMIKLDRPKGLIRYNTLNNAVPSGARLRDLHKYVRFLRPRVLYYATIMAAVGGFMLFSMLTRHMVDLNVIHDRNPLYITRADGSVRNVYTVHIVNKTWAEQLYTLTMPDMPKAHLSAEDVSPSTDGQLVLTVKPGKVGTYRVYADLPRGEVSGKASVDLHITNGTYADTYTSIFVAP
ncbi:MAG: cytochrome c oxidase accessory protein CcoG [Proteobacteria bacterium]|nr:cytochrome c oxidase accessory protein CcoG [Pseudomonadota bacterium]